MYRTILCVRQLGARPSLPSAELEGLMKNRGLRDAVTLGCFPTEENRETDNSLAFSSRRNKRWLVSKIKPTHNLLQRLITCNVCHYLIQRRAAAGALVDVQVVGNSAAVSLVFGGKRLDM